MADSQPYVLQRPTIASTNMRCSKRIAVVGGGCAGLAAVWALKDTPHDVFLYDAADRLGGHANTVQWRTGKYATAVDAGFIVLNEATYRTLPSAHTQPPAPFPRVS